MHIEVAYALPNVQQLVRLNLAAGSRVCDAIDQSNLRQQFPGINPAKDKLGIFGRVTQPDTKLRDGDRIEIYRPLLKDPKDARRERARLARK